MIKSISDSGAICGDEINALLAQRSVYKPFIFCLRIHHESVAFGASGEEDKERELFISKNVKILLLSCFHLFGHIF